MTLSCRQLRRHLVAAVLLSSLSNLAGAQSLSEANTAQPDTRPPRVLLDKPVNVVQYQLRRLSTDQLLLIPRLSDSEKYLPVHREIMIRHGVPLNIREQSLTALQILSHKSAVQLLIESIQSARPDDQEITDQLSQLLLSQNELGRFSEILDAHANDPKNAVRVAVRCGQVVVQGPIAVWESLPASGKTDLLQGMRLLDPKIKTQILPLISAQLADDKLSQHLNRTALSALEHIPDNPTLRMQLAVGHLNAKATSGSAITLINSISPNAYPVDLARLALDRIVREARQVPQDQRGDEPFVSMMECANNLNSVLPVEENRDWRDKLAKLAVRIVHINAVFDQMRFDQPYFVVQCGEKFQLVFRNQDMMPHNLVITKPGELREIGIAASQLTPSSSTRIQYVPDSDKILSATELLPPRAESRLMMTAPWQPGQYPFVCTFPGHWYRMYGVMLVVDDMANWLQQPTAPEDPLGITRRFVQHWTLTDFDDATWKNTTSDALAAQQGAAIFTEAGCIKCHRIDCQGSTVGPALDGVLARLGGDRRRLLREVVDPSYAIADEFANYTLSLHDGGIVSGLITKRTELSVTVVSNPEQPTAAEVPRKEIEEISRLSVSLMPSGLLDQYTKAEIRSLLAFLEQAVASEEN